MACVRIFLPLLALLAGPGSLPLGGAPTAEGSPGPAGGEGEEAELTLFLREGRRHLLERHPSLAVYGIFTEAPGDLGLSLAQCLEWVFYAGSATGAGEPSEAPTSVWNGNRPGRASGPVQRRSLIAWVELQRLPPLFLPLGALGALEVLRRMEEAPGGEGDPAGDPLRPGAGDSAGGPPGPGGAGGPQRSSAAPP